MAGVIEMLRSRLGAVVTSAPEEDAPAAPVTSFPVGTRPDDWIRRADRDKPPDYGNVVSIALNYYLGQSRKDTVAWLCKVFPRTGIRMTPVALNVVERIIREQARVYDGHPDFGLVADDGTELVATTVAPDGKTTVYDPRPDAWADVIEDARLHIKLVQANRLTRLLKRTFVAVTGDEDCCELRVFTPDRVHVLFAQDSRDVEDAQGVLLDVDPVYDADGKKVRRWEFWSAEEHFFVLESGERQNDATGGLNPYGRIPVVTFADFDCDLGYWLLPSDQLVDAARNLNTAWTDLLHIARVQGFGQPVAQTVDANPEQWPPEQTFGPDQPLIVPRGWTLDFKGQGSELASLVAAIETYLKHLATFEALPASALVAGTGAPVSGVALEIERRPLSELRAEQVELYRHPTECLLELVMDVWNAHHPGAEFKGCEPRFTPGEMAMPSDPGAVADAQRKQIDLGKTSLIEILMDERGLTRPEAETLAKQLAADNAPRMAAQALGRVSLFGPALAAGVKRVQDAGAEPMREPMDGAPMADDAAPDAKKVTVQTHERAMPGAAQE